MENTALQDLINELEQFKKFPMVDQATITAAIDFAKLRLEKEREQIIEAFNEASSDGDQFGYVYFSRTYTSTPL